jgi:soluble lytic murein transglycosylase-like protein
VLLTNIIAFCFLMESYYNIQEGTLPAMIKVESEFKQSAISYKGAYGILQVTEGAFIDYIKYNPNGLVSNFQQVKDCWKANINVGSWYLKNICYREKGNWKDAISAYFWGPYQTNKITYKYYNKVRKIYEECR